MAITWVKLPFILHATIETLAASSFILKPEGQLPSPNLETRLVLQQLGGLLLSTNLICLGCVFKPVFDDTSRTVAASLAFWHLWPMRRAWVRLSKAADAKAKEGQVDPDKVGKTLGGPAVHFAVHLALANMLAGVALLHH